MEDNHYIDKKVLFEELVKYNEARKTNPGARIPEYIGKAILLICQGLAMRPNFSNYTYIEDMKSDGIEDCLHAVKNFDPTKSKNGFGYFSQVAWWAFVQRIGLEKKQQYLKHKNYQNNFTLLDAEYHNSVEQRERSFLSEKVITDFERSLTKPKKKSKKETNNVKPKSIVSNSRDCKEPGRVASTRTAKRTKSSVGKRPGRPSTGSHCGVL